MKTRNPSPLLIVTYGLFLLAMIFTGSLQAANMLTNGSFESGSFAANRSDGGMSLANGSTSMTGWTVVNGEIAWIPNSNPYGIAAQNGSNSLDISGYHDTSPFGGVSQTVTTTPGTSYQLSFYLAVIPSTSGFNGPISVKVSAGSQSQTINYDTGSATGTTTLWQQFTYTFTATASSTTISIVGTFTSGGQYMGLDNVYLDVSAVAPFPPINLLTNGSFEFATNYTTNSSGFNSLASGSTALTGWTVINQELGWTTDSNSYGATAENVDNGHFSLDLTGAHDSPPPAGIAQTVTTTAGTSYLLSFYLGTVPSRTGFYGPVSATVTAGPLSATATDSDGYNSGGSTTTVWKKFNYFFTANSTSTTVSLAGATATGGAYFGLDAVSLVANHVQVEGGYGHAIALGGDGSVFTWGLNTNGQLGLGNNTSSSTPALVTGLGTPVDGVSPWAVGTAAGNYHSVAALADGSVWTWGLNTSGQLGNGTTTSSNIPVQVSSFGATGTTPRMVAAGNNHTLAILSDGTVWAWGSNTKGQLGHHSLATQSTTPWQVMISPSVPTYITTAVSISGGVDFSMALTSAGTVYTWGDNTYGQLGLGSGATATKTVATLIPTSTLSGITAIASGANHGMALKSDGTVWTWGDNTYGQLGNGTTTASPTPVQVSGLTNIVAINAGGYFSLALDSTGHVYAWGSDSNGQLCDGFSGSSHNQTSPQLIPALNPSGGVSVMSLAAGMYFALVMNTDGSIEGFGQNSYGQLGNGATTSAQRSPVTTNYNALSD